MRIVAHPRYGQDDLESRVPAARHTHPLGQTLIVTNGCGWVQREGGPVEQIRPGDVVWFEPGEKHWHGATATTAMTHIAIAEALDGKAVDWMEQVSDEQYPALLHLLRMQDEERRRIGREIHGGLGQYLSVLKMKLDSMGSSQATAEENTECANLVEECVKEVRTISYLLYPPMLEEIGLTSAIPWYLEGFSKRSGIKTSFEAASTPEPAGGNEPSPGILFCSGLAFAT